MWQYKSLHQHLPLSTVDWHLFGQVVQAAVVLLNDAASSVGALVSKNISDLLPGFSGVDVADNE